MKLLRKNSQPQDGRKNRLTVMCIHCKSEHPLDAVAKLRPVGLPEGDIQEMGILCPDCGFWKGAGYQTPAICIARAALEMPGETAGQREAALQHYRDVYQAEQGRVKAMLKENGLSRGIRSTPG